MFYIVIICFLLNETEEYILKKTLTVQYNTIKYADMIFLDPVLVPYTIAFLLHYFCT